MRASVQRIERDIEKAPKGFSRWPGAATRIQTGKRAGQIQFLEGIVIAVSIYSISVETSSKMPGQKFLKLLGDSYIHVCPGCKMSVPANITSKRPTETRCFCPWCGPGFILAQPKVGDRVKLHHRFDTQGNWAQWYGEVVP